MVSWTMRTARSLSSAGCRCPDPCFGVCCFDAAMGYILPKNAASTKPRAVHALGRRNRLDFGTVMPRVQIPSPDQIRIQSHPAGGFNVTSPVVVVNPPTGDFAVL